MIDTDREGKGVKTALVPEKREEKKREWEGRRGKGGREKRKGKGGIKKQQNMKNAEREID